MEKIRLKNGQVFDIIPMSINTNNNTKSRLFKIISALSSNEIKEIFTKDNIAIIEYILEDGTINKTYYDCVSLKGTSVEYDAQVDENITADVYTVELSIDAIERMILSLKSEIAELKQENQILKDTVDVLVLSSLEV